MGKNNFTFHTSGGMLLADFEGHTLDGGYFLVMSDKKLGEAKIAIFNDAKLLFQWLDMVGSGCDNTIFPLMPNNPDWKSKSERKKIN